MKYYTVYEEFDSWYDWELKCKKFPSFGEMKVWVEKYKMDKSIRNITGPFIKVSYKKEIDTINYL